MLKRPWFVCVCVYERRKKINKYPYHCQQQRVYYYTYVYIVWRSRWTSPGHRVSADLRRISFRYSPPFAVCFFPPTPSPLTNTNLTQLKRTCARFHHVGLNRQYEIPHVRVRNNYIFDGTTAGNRRYLLLIYPTSP